jgi:hypothetical protein
MLTQICSDTYRATYRDTYRDTYWDPYMDTYKDAYRDTEINKTHAAVYGDTCRYIPHRDA